jgi:hypothetical protein
MELHLLALQLGPRRIVEDQSKNYRLRRRNRTIEFSFAEA